MAYMKKYYKTIWIVLMGLQLYFHKAMKHENDLAIWLPLSPSCEKLQFHERNLSIRTRFAQSLSLLKRKIIIL